MCPFLIVFITAFAAIVGPLNLYWLAGGARRHRLFWTTPLISLAASLLLVVVILLQDGFGGVGKRVLLTYILPGEKKAVVLQEQVTRTGVLLGREFDVQEDVFLTPLLVPTRGGRNEARNYHQSGPPLRE
jgi:amino acid transporter